VSRQQLVRIQKRIDERGIDPDDATIRLPHDRISENGDLVLRLSASSAPFHLNSAKQLGL